MSEEQQEQAVETTEQQTPEEVEKDKLELATELIEAALYPERAQPTEQEAEPEAAAEMPDETVQDAEEGEDESPEQAETPDIDYDMLVPMPGGEEPMKLGELKDMAVNARRNETEMVERENSIMRERDELRQMIQAVGEVPPEVKQNMQKRMQHHLEREHEAMLEAIPEWKEPAQFKADRTAIVELGASYGFTPEEISQIADHRAVKILRDYARMMNQRKANVAQFEKAAKPKAKVKQKEAGHKAAAAKRFERARSGSLQEKMAAIDELIAG